MRYSDFSFKKMKTEKSDFYIKYFILTNFKKVMSCKQNERKPYPIHVCHLRPLYKTIF